MSAGGKKEKFVRTEKGGGKKGGGSPIHRKSERGDESEKERRHSSHDKGEEGPRDLRFEKKPGKQRGRTVLL